ncbi:MAG: energy transducer TonB [Muribaculaceae bacterium]|jgi:protein TonB|nr:energy transducer TonB [Muribaculaceae bacterium]
MAKDVDLSSKEWTDVIFEGKNKEFGAYELRRQSDKRHNRAVIFVLIGLILVLIGGYFWGMYSDYRREQRELELQAQLEQQLADIAAAEAEEPEEVEEVPQAVEEPQREEALPEEILNTIKDTEISIAADEEVTEDITSKDDVAESTAAAGSTTFDQGTDDLNVVREHKEEIIVEEKHEPVKEEIFTAVEQMPQFPGGEGELLKYISTHIKYPTMAAENNIQGRVVVKFVVQKDGKVGEVVVLRGKDPDLDKEAVRVVKTLPNFIPGKMNGQAVSVWYTLPINFKLQS